MITSAAPGVPGASCTEAPAVASPPPAISDATPVEAAALEQAQVPELKLEFRGQAREYFRIWIVNLCLTLLTLGIFSAWAKVRKKRYFYAHTLLDGTPFQYLAQPVPILKGRLIAAALAVVYFFAGNLTPALMPYLLVAALVLAPWVISRSAAFNARYSAFRNMTFGFNGNYLGAARALYWLGLIPALVIGSIFSFWGNPWLAMPLLPLCMLLFPWWLQRLRRFIVSNTHFGGQFGRYTATGGQLWAIYLTAGVIALGLSLVTTLPLSLIVQHWKYGWIFVMVPAYFCYAVAFAFVQANSVNLFWDNSTLGPVRFQSSLETIGLLKLYVTNAIGIGASLGLLIPWAVIRTLQYRVDHLRVTATSMEQFHGERTGSVAAVGAEVGEFFDLDLSL
jgi:uncharacterized membrane protein YjgN (DUF898 family)